MYTCCLGTLAENQADFEQPKAYQKEYLDSVFFVYLLFYFRHTNTSFQRVCFYDSLDLESHAKWLQQT